MQLSQSSRFAAGANALAPPCNHVDEWREHPRLQRHAHSFRNHPDKGAVLKKYWDGAQAFASEELLRHAVHVAAWVALLPLDLVVDPVVTPDGQELSVARVLGQFLCERKRIRITPWLQGALHLAALRFKDERGAPLTGHWLELKKMIPQKVWNAFRAECPPLPIASLLERDAQMRGQKRCLIGDGCLNDDDMGKLSHVRKIQKITIARQDALQGVDRVVATEDVLHRARSALNLVDADQMINAVIEAVGLLSLPRKIAVKRTEVEMTQQDQERLQLSHQTKLRDMLLRLLCFKGSSGLDLNDDGTMKLLKVPFACLRQMFKDVNFDTIQARRQWRSLAQLVGMSVEDMAGGEQNNEKGNKNIAHTSGSTILDKIFTPNERIRSLTWVQLREKCKLKCDKCDEVLLSSWYFVYGSPVRILRPQKPHRRCGGIFRSQSIPCIADTLKPLDICEHDRRRSRCVVCGGLESGVCEHNKRKGSCRLCGWRGHSLAART